MHCVHDAVDLHWPARSTEDPGHITQCDMQKFTRLGPRSSGFASIISLTLRYRAYASRQVRIKEDALEALLTLVVDMCAYGEVASGVCNRICSSLSDSRTLKSSAQQPKNIVSPQLQSEALKNIICSSSSQFIITLWKANSTFS